MLLQKLRKNGILLGLALAFLGCVAPVAFGQAVGASLNGQVADPTGAAIPGAKVTAKNVDTGLTLTAISSEIGVYRVAPLPPGTYSLSVQAQGFQGYLQQGITITVDTPTTQNVTLKTGDVQQTVTVTARSEEHV